MTARILLLAALLPFLAACPPRNGATAGAGIAYETARCDAAPAEPVP